MGAKEILVLIENHGISLIFMAGLGIAFWRHGIPVLKEQTRALTEMRKFLEKYNADLISGKGLHLLLELKIQEIRWSLEKKYIEYILKNNIKNNWNNIISELGSHCTKKLLEFDEDLHDITDKITFKTIRTLFKSAIDKVNGETYIILEELKTDGADYETAQRAVKNHMENFQNELSLEIKKLFD